MSILNDTKCEFPITGENRIMLLCKISTTLTSHWIKWYRPVSLHLSCPKIHCTAHRCAMVASSSFHSIRLILAAGGCGPGSPRSSLPAATIFLSTLWTSTMTSRSCDVNETSTYPRQAGPAPASYKNYQIKWHLGVKRQELAGKRHIVWSPQVFPTVLAVIFTQHILQYGDKLWPVSTVRK